MLASGGHFIKGVGPTSSKKIHRKVKAASRNAERDEDDLDLSDTDTRSNLGDSGDDDETRDGNSGGVEFDAGDTVGKALALVTQVGLAPASLHCSNMVFTDSKVATGTRLFPTSVRSGQRS
jgi:hypothetical protein